MPLSNPCPGIDRNVIALACVAITDRPIVPHPVDWLPRRYVLRLRMWRVRQKPYAAMPTIVPTSTSQSAQITTRSAETPPAAPPPGRTIRTRTGRRHPTTGSPADRAAPRPRADRAAVGSLAYRDEIREQPIRSGHPFRQLAKPGEARIDDVALSVLRHQD